MAQLDRVTDRAVFDVGCKTLTLAGQVFYPTRREWDLLVFLARRPNWIRDRNEILDAIMGDAEPFDRAVDSLVSNVRKRGIRAIGTRYTMGYYWSGPAAVMVNDGPDQEP